jgi:hypothetical protein
MLLRIMQLSGCIVSCCPDVDTIKELVMRIMKFREAITELEQDTSVCSSVNLTRTKSAP